MVLLFAPFVLAASRILRVVRPCHPGPSPAPMIADRVPKPPFFVPRAVRNVQAAEPCHV